MKRSVAGIAFLLLCAVPGLAQVKNLQYYIDQALANSPLLNDYRNQVYINRLDSQRIRATYRPQVTGTSNDSYAPVINGFGYDGAITNGGQVSALVGVNQSLVSNRYLRAQFETLRLQNQGIENNARVSEQDLTRTITSQYITAYGDQQQLAFAKEVNELLKKEEDLLKRLTNANVYRQTDYLTFLVTRQQQELSVKQLSLQLQNDFANLNYLGGIIDTARDSIATPEVTVKPLPEMNQSVFFRKFTIDSLTIGNSRALVAFNYKPRLNLFADGGYNSTLTYQPYRNLGTSFGVSLTVPIYDGGQRKIQYSKLNVAENTRRGYRNFFISQYRQQLSQLTQQLNGTADLIDAITNQIKYAEGLINVNIKLLETGDAKIADLVIAVNNYLTAKNLLTQNTTSRLQIITQINYWNR